MEKDIFTIIIIIIIVFKNLVFDCNNGWFLVDPESTSVQCDGYVEINFFGQILWCGPQHGHAWDGFFKFLVGDGRLRERLKRNLI
jgi:hypothetical protein